MTFEAILDQTVAILQRRGRVTYRALKAQFQLDDEWLDVLKEELLFSYAVIDEAGRGLVWRGDVATDEPDARRGMRHERHAQVLLPAVMAWLRQEGRVTYCTLQYVFGIDATLMAEIRKELAFRRLAMDEDGEGLVWVGETPTRAPSGEMTPSPPKATISPASSTPQPVRSAPEAERRQLTVMFCDLVDSTGLSSQLDPEHLREVVTAYQETAAEVIQRYEGHIAQYLGDGLLIYFGFPVAHEDDAQRAVYTSLEIPEAITALNTRLQAAYGVQLAVRIGIHTGPVVVGEMGGGDRHENLALGETPNIAARLEGLAQPNTTVISPATAQLAQRAFVLEALGPHTLKGAANPMSLFAVVGARETEYDDHEAMLSGGFDALVGRDEEIGLLLRRWDQSKESQGQVVLISGEAGLGKSSLVEGLRAHAHQEGHTRIAFRCSPYTANSALYPVIEHLQRVLDWQRDDPDEIKRTKLEQALQRLSLPLEETAPLVASLLSLPLPESLYPALTLSPQQQRQQTYDVLVAWMLEEAERRPLLAVWEDLHWADPSTLELLGLFVEQCATAPMMNVLAYRPAFAPPWPLQSHMTPITLNRLERIHIEALIRRLAREKTLPVEVQAHIVTKTDGVPLYVEEYTKMLLESDLLEESAEQYVLTGPLSSAAIPATLQDSLMARLDSLPTVKEVAQLGSVLGREFDYEMLQALSVIDEPTLQAGLSQLVSHELLYQRGRIPRAKYMFRHALIRDAAYASLLRRTRQQHHQRIAQTLQAQWPELTATQPELVAYHYEEGGLHNQAVRYWYDAGHRASERSAYVEAIAHLTRGVTLVHTLPETPERLQQELNLQVTLGPALIANKGYTAPEVEGVYTRARELCEQVGDAPQLFAVIRGLMVYYQLKGQLQTAVQLGEQLLGLAQSRSEPTLRLLAHYQLGAVLFLGGETISAHEHLSQAVATYTPQEHQAFALRYGLDLGASAGWFLAWNLWLLGYPDQALRHSQSAHTLVQQLLHPYSLTIVRFGAAVLHQFRREAMAVYEQSTAVISLAREQGFMSLSPWGQVLQGWARAMQGQRDAGMTEMRQGIAANLAMGAKTFQPYFLGLLAEANAQHGRPEEGLDALAEALSVMANAEAHFCAAELRRLKGVLSLHQAVPNQAQAETCFHDALDVARRQQAKSWELRAATSLAGLWQAQGKDQDAYDLLAPVYAWFTEGFDTADLKDAKTLLDELAKT